MIIMSVEDLLPFTCGVADQDVASGRVCPPPEGGVEDEAEQDGHGQGAVDQGDLSFGVEDRVVERGGGGSLTAGQGEHHCGGDRGPGDAERRVLRVEAGDQHEGRYVDVGGQIHSG
ncbi:hypothetical protein [Streptomyces sp. NPDC059468]|uniref:hypothetical protein n=1 Tax=unclassified Streptomyces TaxID=2593676 RepID=UPI0036BC95A0